MKSEPSTNELIEQIFSLLWYSTIIFIAHTLIFRFGSDAWIGFYPLSGFMMAVLISHLALTIFESDGWRRNVRMIIPGIVFLLVWYNGDFTKGIVRAFQDSLGILEFFIIFFSIIVSYIFSLDGESTTSKTKDNTKTTIKTRNQSDIASSFEKIVGQEHVIEPLKEIARLARSNIKVGKDNAPFAVMLFLGPTGVGKTEAARALAEAVYGSSNSMIRFDMGQFADAHQANRFYGPPPGYVGYEQGGQLTRAVLKKPRSVILLDEVEKADPKIWDAFLTVFDEGYIVDGSSNQKVDMTKTCIVLTSNLLSDTTDLNKSSPIEVKEAVLKTGAFRTELIGRINEIFVFNSLGKETIREILQLRIDNALWSLSEQGIKISIEPDEVEQMVHEIEAAKFGVRQIDDVLRKKLRTILSKQTNRKQID